MSESPEEAERQKRLQAIAARTESSNSRGMSKKGWQAKGAKEVKASTPVRKESSGGGNEDDDERRKRLEAFEARNAAANSRGMANKRPTTTTASSASAEPSSPSSPPQVNKGEPTTPLDEERRKRLEAMEQRVASEKTRGLSKAGWKGREEATSERREHQKQQQQQQQVDEEKPKPAEAPSPATAEESAAEELRRLRLQNMEQRKAPAVVRNTPPPKAAPTPTPTPQKSVHSDPTEAASPVTKKPKPEPPPLSKSAQAALDRVSKAPAGISKETAEEMALRREKNDLLGSIEAHCKLNGVTVPFALPSCSLEKLREFKQSLVK